MDDLIDREIEEKRVLDALDAEEGSELSSTDRHCEFCHIPMAAADCCDSEFESKGCPHSSTERVRPKIIGRVTGKEYDGDQVPGMPGAICHACGLKDYPCVNPDCPHYAHSSTDSQTLIGGTNFCGHGMMAAICPQCSVAQQDGKTP